MMPDLGKYAVEVLSAYAASLVLLVVFVLWTVKRGKAVRARLETLEADVKGKS